MTKHATLPDTVTPYAATMMKQPWLGMQALSPAHVSDTERILITTYGVGVARFLAYSSTLIGILLSVMLRLFYIYPLRERLITEKE